MREMTGDLENLKETRFKEINNKLEKIDDLTYDELIDLKNELNYTKDDYIKYLGYLAAKEPHNRLPIVLYNILMVVMPISILLSGDFTFNILTAGALVGAFGIGYYGFHVVAKNSFKSNAEIIYKAIISDINKLTIEKEPKNELKEVLSDDREEVLSETRYGYTLSSVFPTPEIEEKVMKVVKDKKDSKEEQQLTLKRDLTNKN